MIRLTIFVIVLLLLVDAIEASGPWFVTLAVLSGIELVRRRPFGAPRLRARLAPWSERFDW